jgi:hypothetical protein
MARRSPIARRARAALAACLAALAGSCGGTAAVPAPPPTTVLVVPAPAASPAVEDEGEDERGAATAIRSIAGTTWAGTDSDGDDYTFRFMPGGALHYTSPTGSYENGTWTQEGKRVAFEMNDHYSDYEGTIEGETMQGKASNKAGHAWTWSVTRRRE